MRESNKYRTQLQIDSADKNPQDTAITLMF